MLDTSLPISSAVSIINKDVGIIKDEEARLNINLPILNKTHALLAETMKSMASLDDAWINQFYLGLDSSRKDLAVQQAASTYSISSADQESKTDALLLAHAVINFQSAYETFAFAEALELLGEKQRQMWFTIIAGAAGASRIFSEVIPEAFEAVKSGSKWQDGFKSYARRVFDGVFKGQLDGLVSFLFLFSCILGI